MASSLTLPRIDPWRGSHRSTTGKRAKRPKDDRYKGSHRGVPAPAAPPAPTAPSAASRGRAGRPGVRVGGSDDRPDSRPRSRFSGGDQVAARIDYERRQRDELAAQRAAGGGKSRASQGTPSRGQARTMGQPKPARSRFKGESSSAEKNATARKLNPHAPTVRGTATRKPAALPTAKKTPARAAQHRRDPEPQLTGRSASTSSGRLSGSSFFFGGK